MIKFLMLTSLTSLSHFFFASYIQHLGASRFPVNGFQDTAGEEIVMKIYQDHIMMA